MSSIVTEQGILHYESIGRGQPVILLHGWINSWDVWRDCMIALATNGHYRVYALDFWGFGSSAKSAPAASYKIDSYVAMVHQFMNTLGIQSAPLFGHSMGGTVALKFALRYPERTSKVAVVGSPILGQTLNPILKVAGQNWIVRLVEQKPDVLQPVMHRMVVALIRVMLARDSRKVRDMITRDVQQTTVDSFVRSIGDLKETDLRESLHTLHMPTLGIFGANDNIVAPQNNVRLMAELIETSAVTVMEHSRHFPMIDEPDRFLNTLDLFLSNGSESFNDRQRVNGHGP